MPYHQTLPLTLRERTVKKSHPPTLRERLARPFFERVYVPAGITHQQIYIRSSPILHNVSNRDPAVERAALPGLSLILRSIQSSHANRLLTGGACSNLVRFDHAVSTAYDEPLSLAVSRCYLACNLLPLIFTFVPFLPPWVPYLHLFFSLLFFLTPLVHSFCNLTLFHSPSNSFTLNSARSKDL